MNLKLYRVNWKIRGGGAYVPPDPVAGGDYHSDKHGTDLITCFSAKSARSLVQKARHEAIITGVHLVGEVV